LERDFETGAATSWIQTYSYPERADVTVAYKFSETRCDKQIPVCVLFMCLIGIQSAKNTRVIESRIRRGAFEGKNLTRILRPLCTGIRRHQWASTLCSFKTFWCVAHFLRGPEKSLDMKVVSFFATTAPCSSICPNPGADFPFLLVVSALTRDAEDLSLERPIL
jgi:hypothetical protein